MEKEHVVLLIFSFFLLKLISGADEDCLPAACSPTEPQVLFPFRIIGRQPSWCGFPGFDLSCNKQNRTILRLPLSRSYIVNRISYVSQDIFIDPEFCRPNRIADLNLTDSPFYFFFLRSYTFYNCSLRNFGFIPGVRFSCLSTANYSVIAVRTESYPRINMPSSCQVMKSISVPVQWNGGSREELQLTWSTPYCRACEADGGRACGWKSNEGRTVCLGSSRGLPRSAKYGLSIGIGIPVLICIFGLVWFATSKVRDYNDTRHQSVDLFSITVNPQPPSTTGLDGPTIESYPKTVLGESCRLPNDDITCAICLSEYKPKESLRTIPECNHYFHAECIDEWLKLNATCPVCRNLPESLLLVTSCSLTLSASVDSS